MLLTKQASREIQPLDQPHDERETASELLAALEALPFCDAVHGGHSSDEPQVPARDGAVVQFRWAGRRVELVLMTRRNVYPRDAREVIWRMDALRANRPGAIPVLVADAISGTAKNLLRANRSGYYDAGGSLFLCTEPVYVHIERATPRPMASRVVNLFRGSRAQVVHQLLLQPSTWFGATNLAGEASVSPGTASTVLRHLEAHEWVETRGRGPTKKRRVRDAGRLLDAWAESNNSIRLFSFWSYYVPVIAEPSLAIELHRVFEAHGVDYGLTGESAAQRYAPFLSSVSRVHCMVAHPEGAATTLRDIGARPVDQGANLSVYRGPFRSALASRKRVDGVWLASPVLVYLDLLRAGGRGYEMARHLRRERLGY